MVVDGDTPVPSGTTRGKPKIIKSRKRKRRQSSFIKTVFSFHGSSAVVVASVAILYGVYLALTPPPPPQSDYGNKSTTTTQSPSGKEGKAPLLCPMEIINTFPHDDMAFTQGLVIHEGRMYESTGLYGESLLKEVDYLGSGKSIRETKLNAKYFGEGLAIHQDSFYQLTWREGLIFEYDFDFKKKSEHRLQGEGWGLTTVSSPPKETTAAIDQNKELSSPYFLMTNGSNVLSFLDSTTLQSTRYVEVYFVDPARGSAWPVSHLNEIEFIDGRLYANIWGSDKIVVIDIESGRVTHMLDLSILPETDKKSSTGHEDVLNGIAFDTVSRRLFVTGKRWSRLYEVRLPDFSKCMELGT